MNANALFGNNPNATKDYNISYLYIEAEVYTYPTTIENVLISQFDSDEGELMQTESWWNVPGTGINNNSVPNQVPVNVYF